MSKVKEVKQKQFRGRPYAISIEDHMQLILDAKAGKKAAELGEALKIERVDTIYQYIGRAVNKRRDFEDWMESPRNQMKYGEFCKASGAF